MFFLHDDDEPRFFTSQAKHRQCEMMIVVKEKEEREMRWEEIENIKRKVQNGERRRHLALQQYLRPV